MAFHTLRPIYLMLRSIF